MKNIAVFASGKGSNFAAIIRAVKKKTIKASLALLVCDNPQAGAIAKAKRAGVKVALVRRDDFPSKEAFEKEITRHLEENAIDLVVLAGFMRMLSASFVRCFPNRIVNIHPALLPAFKGSRAILDAFDYGVKITGVTVHFVDEKMDHGPIILQGSIPVKENDDPASLEAKIHALEHKLYPEAVRLVLEGKAEVSGRKVMIR